MSHIEPGPLAAYNSLMDPNLSGYFADRKKRKHLRKQGLITRKGEIVSENTYRMNMARKEHQTHVRDLLAQAIVHKTLDMERNRQVEIKKKLEEISKIELVHRVKTERGRQGDEDILPFLAPGRIRSRPSSVPSNHPRRLKSRPVSAPTKGSRRKNSRSQDKYASVYVDESGYPVSPRDVSPASDSARSVPNYPADEIDDRHLYALDQTALQQYTKAMERSRGGSSPYHLPQLPMMESLPSPPPKHTGSGSAKRGRMGRQRRSSRNMNGESPTRGKPVCMRGQGSTKGNLMLHRVEPAMKHQDRVQTMCDVTMHYFGSSLHLEYERFDPRDEILVEQQHCGGNTLPVFREYITPHTDFTFTSRRHRGFPFSLTFYVNGVLDCRLSACCEYKHAQGARLGGKQGHFAVVRVEGAFPCYKCQVSDHIRSTKPKKQKSKKESSTRVAEVATGDSEREEEEEPQSDKDQDSDDDNDKQYRDTHPSDTERSEGVRIDVGSDAEDYGEELDSAPREPHIHIRGMRDDEDKPANEKNDDYSDEEFDKDKKDTDRHSNASQDSSRSSRSYSSDYSKSSRSSRSSRSRSSSRSSSRSRSRTPSPRSKSRSPSPRSRSRSPSPAGSDTDRKKYKDSPRKSDRKDKESSNGMPKKKKVPTATLR